MKRALKAVAWTFALAALASSPVLVSGVVAKRRSEAFRAKLVPGTSWEEVARLLDGKPLRMLSVSFRGKTSCGYAYLSDKGVEGQFVGPEVPGEDRLRMPLKTYLDPIVAATVMRCPHVSVGSRERFDFTKLDFKVEFGRDGKVASTEPTVSWD